MRDSNFPLEELVDFLIAHSVLHENANNEFLSKTIYLKINQRVLSALVRGQQ